jgi:hypothetical protein
MARQGPTADLVVAVTGCRQALVGFDQAIGSAVLIGQRQLTALFTAGKNRARLNDQVVDR